MQLQYQIMFSSACTADPLYIPAQLCRGIAVYLRMQVGEHAHAHARMRADDVRAAVRCSACSDAQYSAAPGQALRAAGPCEHRLDARMMSSCGMVA
jgi:hypothetical protein